MEIHGFDYPLMSIDEASEYGYGLGFGDSLEYVYPPDSDFMGRFPSENLSQDFGATAQQIRAQQLRVGRGLALQRASTATVKAPTPVVATWGSSYTPVAKAVVKVVTPVPITKVGAEAVKAPVQTVVKAPAPAPLPAPKAPLAPQPITGKPSTMPVTVKTPAPVVAQVATWGSSYTPVPVQVKAPVQVVVKGTTLAPSPIVTIAQILGKAISEIAKPASPPPAHPSPPESKKGAKGRGAVHPPSPYTPPGVLFAPVRGGVAQIPRQPIIQALRTSPLAKALRVALALPVTPTLTPVSMAPAIAPSAVFAPAPMAVATPAPAMAPMAPTQAVYASPTAPAVVYTPAPAVYAPSPVISPPGITPISEVSPLPSETPTILAGRRFYGFDDFDDYEASSRFGEFGEPDVVTVPVQAPTVEKYIPYILIGLVGLYFLKERRKS